MKYMRKSIIPIILGVFLISLSFISSSSDVQVWSGQYFTGTTYLTGNYSFNFTIYDALTGGAICYSNTTNLSTGTLGQWTTDQYDVLKSCNNESKNYWVNINIAGVDQSPRRRLTLLGNYTGYYLYNQINSINVSYNNILMLNESSNKFKLNDTIVTMYSKNSLLSNPTNPSGGINIIQTTPEGKGGIWWDAYDKESATIRPAAWIVAHFNSSANSDEHSHFAIETLDNSSGTPSINSHFYITYGSTLPFAKVAVSNADFDIVNLAYFNKSGKSKITPATTFEVYPNNQNSFALSVSNNSDSITLSALGVNTFQFNDNLNVSEHNVTASNFLGNINWSYIQNIPAYVKDWTSDINKTFNQTLTDSLYRAQLTEISWSNLTGYPAACPANNFMTQVGDTITCTSVQETPLSLKVDGNLTVVENLNPLTNLISSIGNSTLRWLKGWFGDLDVSGTATVNNLVVNGNFSAVRPYGMFSSTQTQVITNPNTAYPVTFNYTEDSHLIYKASDNANFTFGDSGDYLIEISAIADVDTPNKHVELWAQKNGVNIPRSNTKVELPTATTETLIVVPFIIDMNTTDVFRLMMASDDGGSQLLYTTNTSYSPETPSIIITFTKISEIPSS